MNQLVTAIPTGVAAFIATNIDDLLILALLFSQVSAIFRPRHIITGQYLGFSGLLLASLPGCLGGLILPQHWIGLLGLVPIVIGISRLLNSEEDSDHETEEKQSNSFPLSSVLSPQTCSVAAVTFANGGDNIGIYMPLFASSEFEELMIILSVFFMLVGILCYAAYKFTCQRAIAEVLTRYGNALVPYVLIGIGVFIAWDSGTLANLPTTIVTLSISCSYLLGIVIINGRTPEVAKN